MHGLFGKYNGILGIKMPTVWSEMAYLAGIRCSWNLISFGILIVYVQYKKEPDLATGYRFAQII